MALKSEISISGRFSRQARQKRSQLLFSVIPIDPDWSVLDLGGGDGTHINAIMPWLRNVTVCDHDAAALRDASKNFGFRTVLTDASGTLPFADGEFDFVFCSSVIEHVTGPKEDVLAVSSSKAFRLMAQQHQSQFAKEIRRVGLRYYVQTPHRHFVIESHSWLPWPVHLLPRPLLRPVLRISPIILPKATRPDWHLLTVTGMQELFPEADVFIERKWGVPKSIMSIWSGGVRAE